MVRFPSSSNPCFGSTISLAGADGRQPGDPRKGAQAIVDVVRGEGAAAGKPFPRELLLGTDCYQTAKSEAKRHLEEVEAWQSVSCGTDFTEGK